MTELPPTVKAFLAANGRKGGMRNTTPQNVARKAAMRKINLAKKKRKLARKARALNRK